MRLFNTLNRRKEDFLPLEDGRVRMYVCGPTVYDFIHIGNARPFVIFDTVRRYLEYKGFHVTFVQNFTDIDDKIIKRGAEEGISADEVANKYIAEFYEDADGLNILRASANPRVTAEMPAIIEMIGTLVDKGFAYTGRAGVYFETAKLPGYGKLSGKDPGDLLAGARVAVEDEKRGPADFVLWKPAKPGEPGWDSPWGRGRPGWHIECSVMAKKYLGDSIDIHAGGEDLIFPHHENEIAQSESANGCVFARYWLHNGMITIGGGKMSKSENNFLTVREIAGKYHYDTIRFFILSGHYRMPLSFGEEPLRAAASALVRIRSCAAELAFIADSSAPGEMTPDEARLAERADEFRRAFEDSMDDDFNTANAVTAVFELVSFANANCVRRRGASAAFARALSGMIAGLCGVLGIRETAALDERREKRVKEMLDARARARAASDWALSDGIRDELTEMGVMIKDTRDGVRWAYTGIAAGGRKA
jgi:cysteinyl-tRNA synthetase